MHSPKDKVIEKKVDELNKVLETYNISKSLELNVMAM
jgi:hypothetical protein